MELSDLFPERLAADYKRHSGRWVLPPTDVLRAVHNEALVIAIWAQDFAAQRCPDPDRLLLAAARVLAATDLGLRS